MNNDTPNKSMDVRAKQRLSYQRLSLNSKLSVAGFAPRHLNRSAAKVEMHSINIRKINTDDICACTSILRSLPNWFGIEESILEYERNLASLDGYVAEADATIVGFVGLRVCLNFQEASCLSIIRIIAN